MKNSYSIFYIFIFGLFLLGCSRDTIESESQSTLNSAPQKVTVIIDNIQSNSANISWSKAQDADNDSILYDIVLNNVIVLKDSKKLLFKLDNLLELTEYNGKIIAKDTHNNYSETSFNFKTLKYYLKYEKHIYFSLDPNYFSGLVPKEIIKLSDGYLIGGYTGKTNGAIFFALKIDFNGNVIWKKIYENQCFKIEEFKMKKTNNEEVLILGDNFLFKIDRNGNQIWNKKFQEYQNLIGQITSFDIDSDNSIYLVGYRKNTQNNDQIGYLSKLNSEGNLIWEKNYYDSLHYDYFNDIIIDNNKILIFGKIETDKNGFENFYFIKSNKNGDKETTKTFDNNCGGAYSKGIFKRNNGNYILYGFNQCASYKTILREINSNGDLIIQKEYEIGGINTLKESSDNKLVMLGYANSSSSYNSRMFFLATQPNGETIWYKDIYEMGNYYYGEDVIPTEDGGFLFLTRHSKNYVTNPEDNGEIIIYKTDPEGNYK
ncbi:fibronectin type III domain-containing protein [Kaistella montana]|uniref:Fibronectin type III domain-containing protein n=1 Tax=Kaistella montana TaxID=1849733 RepID=A0ABW5K8I6_9FLAO|nr:fibronectin type III domain-containing protein [Kaistella montana]MCQ4035075.1 fibronectin type III domain-containing protein [Kaistella montana]